MKITDGKRTVNITIHKWNGSGYDPDWANDYFCAATLPYDEETDTYTVEDVDYCINTAINGGPDEGACWMPKVNDNGDFEEFIHDPDMIVDVEEM